jgi:hypothetical protein
MLYALCSITCAAPRIAMILLSRPSLVASVLIYQKQMSTAISKISLAHFEMNVARIQQDQLVGHRKSLPVWVSPGAQGTVDQSACRHLTQNHHIF